MLLVTLTSYILRWIFTVGELRESLERVAQLKVSAQGLGAKFGRVCEANRVAASSR